MEEVSRGRSGLGCKARTGAVQVGGWASTFSQRRPSEEKSWFSRRATDNLLKFDFFGRSSIVLSHSLRMSHIRSLRVPHLIEACL